MYDKYLSLKNNDSSKIYMFKSGIFYIFLEDDAIDINKLVGLKITSFGNKIIKCGFPINSYDKYMNIFNRLNLNIEEVLDNEVSCENIDYILNRLKKIDINSLSPMEAFEIIKELKGVYE